MAETEQSNQVKNISLSIGCVLHNTDDFVLKLMLESLGAAFMRCMDTVGINRVDCYFVDNNSSQEHKRQCRELVDEFGKNNDLIQFQWIESAKNQGFGAGHTRLLNQLTSDFHLIVNPDVVMDDQSLQVGCKYLATHNEAGMVVPDDRGDDGEIHYIAKSYPSVLALLLRGIAPSSRIPWIRKHLDGYELRKHIPASEPTSVPLASGCFMLLKTNIFKSTGGFDRRYFMYFEDYELSIKLGEQAKIVHLPDMRINHAGGGAANKGLRHIFYFCASAVKFFNKNGWKWL